MTHTRIYPGADTKTQWRGNGTTMPKVTKLLLHTTESPSWPGYATLEPTLTFHPWKPRGQRWRQHHPINGSATALRNALPFGIYKTNRRSVCQVEIVGYCDLAYATRHGYERFHISKMPADAYVELGEFLAWLHTEWEVPLFLAKTWPAFPSSYGNGKKQRMSTSEFTSFSGVCGHMHAPGNSHGDPGNLDVKAILDAAKAALIPPTPPVKPPVPPTPPKPPVPPKPKPNTEFLALSWNVAIDRPAAPQVKIMLASKASVIMLQECGHTEAVKRQDLMGPNWMWTLSGTRTVFWDKSVWKMVTTRERKLPAKYSKSDKSIAMVQLEHRKDGTYFWASSTHLSANVYDGVTADQIHVERVEQAKAAVKALTPYYWIVLGADLNTSSAMAGAPRDILAKGGWTFLTKVINPPTPTLMAGILHAPANGIDDILAKNGVTILGGQEIPAIPASDHNAFLARCRINAARQKSIR